MSSHELNGPERDGIPESDAFSSKRSGRPHLRGIMGSPRLRTAREGSYKSEALLLWPVGLGWKMRGGWIGALFRCSPKEAFIKCQATFGTSGLGLAAQVVAAESR